MGPPGNANVKVVQFTLDSDTMNYDGNMAWDTVMVDGLADSVAQGGTVQAFVEQFGDGRLAANATVMFNNQHSPNGETVFVASTWLPADGYIAIHGTTTNEQGEVETGPVIGVSSFLEAGMHENVEVTFDQPIQDDQVLVAMAHEETNDNEEFNFGEDSADGPFTHRGGPVTDDAFVTVGNSEAGIYFDHDGQTYANSTDMVVVGAALLPTNDDVNGGFVAIYNEGGDIIGSSNHLADGFHRRINVDLDQTISSDQTLTAKLHRDNPDDENFTYPTANSTDTPYQDSEGNEVSDDARIIITTDGETATRIAARVNGHPNSLWTAIPVTFYQDTNGDGEDDTEVQLSYGHDGDMMVIKFNSLDSDAVSEDALDGEYNFKTVIIPPAEAGETSERFETFEQAARELGLTERQVVTLN